MIYPQAVWRPGVNAGYRAGRNRMQLVVCHYTVGRDSAPVGDRGYFNWLIRRDGEVVQFAEADALTWHAGTANQWGPGIEVEYQPGQDDDLWTPAAYQAAAGLVEWLIGLGIPDRFYDGPRIDPAGFHGFLTHRSVQQPDGHSDWWPELPRIYSTSDKGGSAMIYVDVQNNVGLAMEGPIIVAEFTGTPNQYGIPQDAVDYAGDDIPLRVVPALLLAKLRKADALAMTDPPTGGGGGGLTADDVKRIVRTELDATRLVG